MEHSIAAHEVPFAVLGLNLELRVTAWNERAELLFGVTRGEALARVVTELAPAAGGEASWRAVLEDSDGAAVRLTLADGRTLEWTPASARDEQGRRVGVVCYGRDVTAKHAEERRAAIEQTALRAFLRNISAVVSVFDREGVYLMVEGKGVATAGLRSEQLVGKDALELWKGTPLEEFVRRGLAGEATPMSTHEQFGAIWESWHIPMPPESEAGLVTISIEVTESRTRERQLREKLELIERQQRVIRELSTPIIEVWEGVLALPLIGVIDSARTAEIMDNLLQRVARSRAHVAILEMTGIEVVDTATANHLIAMIRALRLLGCEGVITGIHPNIAQTIVTLGVDLRGLSVHATLRDALRDRVALGRGAAP